MWRPRIRAQREAHYHGPLGLNSLWANEITRGNPMYLRRMASRLLLGALVAGCSDRDAPTAPSGHQLAASAAQKVPVASVTVTPTPATISTNATLQLTATLKDANANILTGRTVTWTSSTTSVATVSSSGLVTGVAVGSARITATSEAKSGTSSIK